MHQLAKKRDFLSSRLHNIQPLDNMVSALEWLHLQKGPISSPFMFLPRDSFYS